MLFTQRSQRCDKTLELASLQGSALPHDLEGMAPQDSYLAHFRNKRAKLEGDKVALQLLGWCKWQ